MTQRIYENIPVVALRGLVVLPGELLHFDAGREKSVNALREAMRRDDLIFLSAQRDARKAEITPEDIFETGTLCKLRQMLTLPGDSNRVFVEGLCRATAVSIADGDAFMTADIACLEDKDHDPAEAEALHRRLSSALAEYATMSTRMNSDALASIESKKIPGPYADAVANAIMQKASERQPFLEESDPVERMKWVLRFMGKEIEILRADRRIAKEVQTQLDKNQKEYYLREQIKAIRKELGDTQATEVEAMRERLEKKDMPPEIREKVEREIERYGDLPAGSHEQPPLRTYIECMLELPLEGGDGGQYGLGQRQGCAGGGPLRPDQGKGANPGIFGCGQPYRQGERPDPMLCGTARGGENLGERLHRPGIGPQVCADEPGRYPG